MASLPEGPRVLVVDDNPEALEVLGRNLRSNGYLVFTAAGVEEAIRLLEGSSVDIVITDLKMPRASGMDLVRHVRENLPDTEVMMVTGYPTIGGAVQAVKTGAEEYLAKPFTDEELLSAVGRAIKKLGRRRAARAPSYRTPRAPQGLVGESDAMQEVFRAIAKVAHAAATVLISGESGTGKELVARAIHYGSSRASAPFVPVGCGAVPEPLLESELFGHVRGAFTGAAESRAGFFQTAEGGTIFLDEIDSTTLSVQVKLLRVLQSREIYMVGSSRARKADVRILAATNHDLQTLVKKGLFREDLYFRLNVLTIQLPPLRRRGDDVLLLLNHFVERYARELDRPAPRFSDRALELLRNYSWPGNVRELENLVQRLVVMREGGVIDAPDLPSLMRFSAPRGPGLDRTLAQVEAEHIRNVLAAVQNNKTHAARALGIDRKTLREKMRAYGLIDS